jgi:hypothetical protein
MSNPPVDDMLNEVIVPPGGIRMRNILDTGDAPTRAAVVMTSRTRG